MAEDQPKGPGFLGRLFGVDPAEEKRRLEEAERDLRKIKELSAQLPKIIDARIAEHRKASEAHLAPIQAKIDRVREQQAHSPEHLDTASDKDAMMKAAMNHGSVADARNKTTIYQWNDGYGNIIYLNPTVPTSQVQTVSARITEQQRSFEALRADEQLKTRTEFGSAKDAIAANPYLDFLRSEALGKRFAELKANPLRPFSPK